jgi:23S rRNA pseudouridine1911/1915/1917 synthase
MNDFIVTAEESGERLDALLARNGLTRSAAQRLIEAGFVTLRGYPVKKNHRTAPGELIEVRLPAPAPSALLPQEFPLDVVYEDGDVIVINKPRGMVVHPAPGHADGTLVNALLFHCGDSLSGIGGEKRPGIVHRLDKDTSGLIIAAKNDFAHLSLSRQLKNRSLTRIYEAVAHGGYREDAGKVDAPIGRDPADRKRMRVFAPSRAPAGARGAVTHWEVVARYSGWTHVRCRLETGRTHQIRVHMAYIGHPLLGDMVYGNRKPEKGLTGQCLHAGQMRFLHPRTGKELRLQAGLPEYFTDVLARLGPREDGLE